MRMKGLRTRQSYVLTPTLLKSVTVPFCLSSKSGSTRLPPRTALNTLMPTATLSSSTKTITTTGVETTCPAAAIFGINFRIAASIGISDRRKIIAIPFPAETEATSGAAINTPSFMSRTKSGPPASALCRSSGYIAPLFPRTGAPISNISTCGATEECSSRITHQSPAATCIHRVIPTKGRNPQGSPRDHCTRQGHRAVVQSLTSRRAPQRLALDRTSSAPNISVILGQTKWRPGHQCERYQSEPVHMHLIDRPMKLSSQLSSGFCRLLYPESVSQNGVSERTRPH